MQATVVDLRYKMKDVLQALDRQESVEILYRGKQKGVIIPHHQKKTQSISKHPFFGMNKETVPTVEQEMHILRRGRYGDL